jgi:hypothetical protein
MAYRTPYVRGSLVARRAAAAINNTFFKSAPRAGSNEPPMGAGRAEKPAQWVLRTAIVKLGTCLFFVCLFLLKFLILTCLEPKGART